MSNYSSDPGLSSCCTGSEKNKDLKELWQPVRWSAIGPGGRLYPVKAGLVGMG